MKKLLMVISALFIVFTTSQIFSNDLVVKERHRLFGGTTIRIYDRIDANTYVHQHIYVSPNHKVYQNTYMYGKRYMPYCSDVPFATYIGPTWLHLGK